MIERLTGPLGLFASLPTGEINYLLHNHRQLELPTDAILFEEGEHGDTFYLILAGEIEIVKARGTTDERLLALRGAGESVGEMSLINPEGLRTASVRARTPALLLELSRADFDALLRRQPAVAYDLARLLSARLAQSDNATIRELQQINRQLADAYAELKAAQEQIIEKEKIEKELQVARRIQESILPRRLPRLPSFDFGARMVPARAVGGDFFDIFALSRDRVGVIVGDVSGKGVPAAIFMALTRSLLRAEASRGVPPRETLARANRHLMDMNDEGMFVTVLYGVLRRSTREFAYARAGHELPLLVDGAGEPVPLHHTRGVALGVDPDTPLDEQSFVLPPGSMLVIYTDGVTDATDPTGAFFGIDRLRDAVCERRQPSAQTACDSLLQAVIAHQGTAPQADDVTLVVVSADDGGQRFQDGSPLLR